MGPGHGGPVSLELTARLPSRGFEADFSVADGETVAVLGPNGAGKSTLLGLISGLLRPAWGRAQLAGEVLFSAGQRQPDRWVPAHARGIGLLAQEPLLFPHLSVTANVAYGPRSHGASRAEAAETARHWLAELDATELAARRPAELSGGQAQRVAVARALAAEPSLLLFDEPMSALDITAAPALRRLLRRVLDGRSAVIVTHEPLDALLLADRVVVMDGGRIVEQGPVREVFARPRSSFAAGMTGLNLVTGTATETGLTDADGVHWSGEAEAGLRPGDLAAAAFRPASVALFTDLPAGSPRNAVAATVTDLVPHGGLVTVRAGWLAAEVTPAAVSDLSLAPGQRVHFVVKAAEVSIYPR
jgi:molybdate transport system ATP-binding protein